MHNLLKLQQWLKQENLDGLLVATEDEYQNEFVPDAYKRLQWATNFSGSVALCVILKNSAAIFVDGRYTLQAELETNNIEISVLPLRPGCAVEWIKKQIDSDGVIGFDARLHTLSLIEELEIELRRRNLTLKALERNPVDQLWQKRPAVPATTVFTHPLAFAGISSADKRKSLSKQIIKADLDFYLVTTPEDIAWLLNIRADDVPFTPVALSRLLINRQGEVSWFIEEDRVTFPRQAHFAHGVTILPPEDLIPILKKMDANLCFGLNLKKCSYQFVQIIRKTSKEIVDVNFIEQNKSVKNVSEIEGAKKAQFMDGLAVTKFLAWLDYKTEKYNVTELQAATKIEELRRENSSFRYNSFHTLSSSGAHAAMAHYITSEASDTGLKTSPIFVIDSGGQYLEGTTDITRSIAISEPTNKQRLAYTLVLKGHIALACTQFPKGTKGYQLDHIARQYLWEYGMDYNHGTGHGVGSFATVHEGPAQISSRHVAEPLCEGMIFSNEPGFYMPGEYGIRIENLILVREAKITGFLEFETLTYVPMDPRLVLFDLLSGKEKQWLHNYHSSIVNQYTDKLNNNESKWLKSTIASF